MNESMLKSIQLLQKTSGVKMPPVKGFDFKTDIPHSKCGACGACGGPRNQLQK